MILSEHRIHEVQEAIFYILVRACVCGVRDHFSEERVKFLTCKVMVVMQMLIRPHCTINLMDNSSVKARHKTWKGECCTTLARLRSMINITGRLHFPEHEDDCMEAYHSSLPFLSESAKEALGNNVHPT